MKVQVLYDFEGQPGTNELSIRSGDILNVTRQDIGEGWWEGTNISGVTGLFPAAYVEPVESVDYWDDEWEEDSDGGSIAPSVQESAVGRHPSQLSRTNTEDPYSVSCKRATTKSNKSISAKSGSDSFIMGGMRPNVPDYEKAHVIDSQHGYIWNPVLDLYTVAVASPKKESKLKGLKSFIVYQLTPSFNNIQVSRRYKHFDWLHERLDEKFSLIPIPPLPDKQIAGRYEEQFIEHRKNQLQAFVDYVCRHPVLSTCNVWKHFLVCTDEKRWKAGKRKAEKDELLGANYFYAIDVPDKSIGSYGPEQENEVFSRYIRGLDASIKNLSNVVADQVKKWQIMYKREYQRIGHSFLTFGHAYGMEERTGYSRVGLTNAIKRTGEAYNEIGVLFEEQAKYDWEPLGDMLHIYKGVIGTFPDVLSLHRSAMQKRRDCERMTSEGKMDAEQLHESTKRTEVVSYGLIAEINNFHADQASELNRSMKNFLAQQIAFHHKVISLLQDVSQLYD